MIKTSDKKFNNRTKHCHNIGKQRHRFVNIKITTMEHETRRTGINTWVSYKYHKRKVYPYNLNNKHQTTSPSQTQDLDPE